MSDITSRGRPSRDIYAEVTAKIIDALDRGVAPWVRPWKTLGDLGGLRNAVSGYQYSGINVMLLGLSMDALGFSDPRWLTYQQARSVGGKVRRGERGTPVVFWKPFSVKARDDERELEARERTIPFLRCYTLFNVAQCDGLDLPEATTSPMTEPERDVGCEDFVRDTGAVVRHGGSVACYRLPPVDAIQMPPRSSFADGGAYYATLFHELVHWTGDESRTPRPFGRTFGDPDYAREELVAEMGSAFLCQEFRVNGTLQHPEYLGHWLAVLKADKRALFHAAAKARKACAFLLREPETASS